MSAERTDFYLRDYLSPGGKHPYSQLVPDLEAALAAGATVYLWSVPGFFVLAGHPEMRPTRRPWSDGDQWYRTAADALRHVRGRRI